MNGPRPLSASKRRRLLANKAVQVDRMLSGSSVGAVGYVECRGRRSERDETSGRVHRRACRERLGAIRYDPTPAGVEVRVEVHAAVLEDAGVIVLEAPPRPGQARTLVTLARAVERFRCPVCGHVTPVDVRKLRQAAVLEAHGLASPGE